MGVSRALPLEFRPEAAQPPAVHEVTLDRRRLRHDVSRLRR